MYQYHDHCDNIVPMQPFKMWNFLIILGVFLFIDVLYLSIWTGAFPFERALAEIEVLI